MDVMSADAIKEVKTITDLSRAFRTHVHDELSLAYVWQGSSLARIDGREVAITGECLVVIPPGVAHACNPVPETGWAYTLTLLAPQRDVPWNDALFAAPYRILGATNRFRDAFQGLRDRVNTGGAWVQELRAAVDEALQEEEGGHSITGAAISTRALRRVMDHLRARLDVPLSLEELCAVAGLSKYHLVRAFRQAYGLTPHAYHLNLRVNHAKTRLAGGETLARVALDCGFCDQGHFTRVFARCVGMTPAQYRKATAIPSKTGAMPRS